MIVTNVKNVGNYFKKENIFLATVSKVNMCTEEAKKNIITSEQFDVFYKDERGYTRYEKEGTETFAGDNSDGKGFIKNIVSIWKYYSEDQVKEVLVNDNFMAIATTIVAPMYMYNNHYNKR